MNAQRDHRLRSGSTLLEALAVLTVLFVAMILVAEVASWSMGERRRNALRAEALEAAANVLERARATSWAELNPEWAAAQRLPADLAGRLHHGRLLVSVEPHASRQELKQVAVGIEWQWTDAIAEAPIRLVALLGRRTEEKEAKP